MSGNVQQEKKTMIPVATGIGLCRQGKDRQRPGAQQDTMTAVSWERYESIFGQALQP